MGLGAKLCKLSGEADLMTRESVSKEGTLGLFVIDPNLKNTAAMQRLRRSVFQGRGNSTSQRLYDGTKPDVFQNQNPPDNPQRWATIVEKGDH